MNIKQYDKVLLKDGATAYIVEILGDGKAFIADINRKDGAETDWVKPQDIEGVLK
jgi:hypothetical protein